ncbi:MAG: FAD-dependent oxidoreductase [Patescibacteria group bacterium]|nr:FAD-dependent oxidoreductase [Patescibacteria group bacterium]
MKLILMERKTDGPEVESFMFKPDGPLTWKAGQFLHYVLHHEPTDGEGSDRWFTVASAPSEGFVMLTTRFPSEKRSTFKKALRELKIGDAIEISDVDGDFLLGAADNSYVFIAGGIGITPFRSILKEALHERKPIDVTLLYANRDEHITYKEELESIAKENPNLKIHYLISPERVDEAKIRELVPNIDKAFFYVSGPEPMTESLGNMLKAMGISGDRIKQDWFPGYPAE